MPNVRQNIRIRQSVAIRQNIRIRQSIAIRQNIRIRQKSLFGTPLEFSSEKMSTKTLRSIFWKNKMKFKNLFPGNHENPFASSFKANFRQSMRK